MTDVKINDSDLGSIRDHVVFITGGASGIGLATALLCIKNGAKVVVGDRNPLPADAVQRNLSYVSLDVTSWESLSAAFKEVLKQHGRVDHVFANAGVGPKTNLLEDNVDENGDLLEPSHHVLDINLKSVMNTTALACHHLKKSPQGGSVVLIGSASSFQVFPAVDYSTSKHGVLGLMRSLTTLLYPKFPIRINALAPSWTSTSIIPGDFMNALGIPFQGPETVARSAVLLMADPSRHGQVIYSEEGQLLEIEEGLRAAARNLVQGDREPIANTVDKMRQAQEAASFFGDGAEN
ncbi:putative oxidoreductase,short chain dehydrogenase [Phyllosticta citribraziliensis]|uniref:Oxidoreductase,short chain dehydrogenase n=1 Tax=Phyllosticta citribraziliensis TaxID=989973 RepID=A0ABR1LHJ7_9PEZI